ncbi:hypothetical protein [Rhodophyticola sp.]|uniref:hypothetical protein n=1 Tax=Rhodophyticola sp. TaxID=2680032 RepID=UPI003D26C83A
MTVEIAARHSRSEITGYPNYHQVSDLGVVQFRHSYDDDLLGHILKRALEIKEMHADKRQLNLNYIRDAASHIPEINDLLHSPRRMEVAEKLSGTRLEPYPISIISSIITFTSARPEDGAITWHADGVPVTELIPLSIIDPQGGELELYRGSADEGLYRAHSGEEIPQDRIISIQHREGFSVLGQLMRLMHRVRPMTRGYRITLNLNFRSAEKPFIDDNTMCYLAADNPDFEWQNAYIEDVKARQLPAYLRSISAASP